MADPEIKLVFNAETGKASKNIQDLYNRILDLEKNRGSDFTDKEIRKINDLIETYAKYEHKVVKFNEYVRQINATEFSNEAVRDKTLENTERKFQIILGYGTQIATAMRDIGINPRVLESFVNLASTLSVANKELDVAFANRERLLKQPTAPKGALVTSYPWENGDSPDNPDTPENQFKKRYAAVAADIEAYQKTLNVTIESTERLKAAFREKYAALKETDEGYIQQKQLLESLMVTTDRQLLSLGKLREGVQGQIEDFEQLYKTTSDSKHWLTGLQGIEERISGVAETQQKVDIAAQNSINIQNKYNNAQLKNNEKAIKSEEKYQAALEVTGMTYEELTQLYSQLLAARARAQTPEQIQAIDRQLTAVRKNITLMGREAQISGAQMIGSQTSVLGVMQQVVSQWRNGTLTLKGLTQGIKLFAKSTLVLAAIQFAWEGISWAMEKAKAAIFGTAEEEEKAVKRAQDLAAAYDEAVSAVGRLANREVDSQKLNDLKNLYRDLNTELRTRNELMDDSLRKLSAELAMRAKEEDFQKTLKRNEIMREFWTGSIDEEERDRRIDELNFISAEQKRQRVMEQRQAELEATQAKEQSELDRYGVTASEVSKLQMEKNQRFFLSPEAVELEYENLLQAENQVKERQKEIARLNNLIKIAKYAAEFSGGNRIIKTAAFAKIEDYQKQIENIDLAAAEEVVNKAKRNLYGINLDDVESGRYKEKYNSINERLKTAKTEADRAKANYEAARAATIAKQSERDLSDAQTQQDVTIASRTAKENAKQRDAQRTYRKNQEERQRYASFESEARRLAEQDVRASKQELERRKKLQAAALFEGEIDGKMTKRAKQFAEGAAFEMLSDSKLSTAEIKKMIDTMKKEANKENESLRALLQEVLSFAIKNGMVTAKTLKKYSQELKACKFKLSDPSR